MPVFARPALWLVVMLLGVGAWRVGVILRSAVESYPVATVAALILFAAYAVPFLVLIGMIDYLEREPLILRAVAFGWGGLVATSAAIAGGTAAQNLIAKWGSPQLAADWGPALGAAGVEEILKVVGVVAIALVAPTRIRSIVDGFVYGALIGLGFQVVENVIFAVNATAVGGGTDQIGPVVSTFLLRGFLGGLWSHALFSALAGAGVAYAIVSRRRSRAVRALVAAVLVGAAWMFHLGWNSPWLADGFGYGAPGVFLALLIKGIPALAVGATLIIIAERRKADDYGGILARLRDPLVATPDEIVALVSPLRRLAERRHARLRLGLAGGRAMRRLQRAQALLAVALSRATEARATEAPATEDRATEDHRRQGERRAVILDTAEITHRRRDVVARRHQLLALGVASRRPVSRIAAVATSGAVGLVAIVLVVIGIGVAVRALGGT